MMGSLRKSRRTVWLSYMPPYVEENGSLEGFKGKIVSYLENHPQCSLKGVYRRPSGSMLYVALRTPSICLYVNEHLDGLDIGYNRDTRAEFYYIWSSPSRVLSTDILAEYTLGAVSERVV